MEFGLSEEQVLLQDSARRTLLAASPLDLVRGAAKQPQALQAPLWQALADLGAFGILVPEAHGGSGLALLDAVLIQEQLGAAVAPVPILGAMIAGPLALARAGSPAQQADWLPRLAAGEVKLGLALTEAAHALAGGRTLGGLALDGGRLSGTAQFALDMAGAETVLVGVGEQLALVPVSAAKVQAVPTIDATRAVATLTFEGAAADVLPGRALPDVLHALWVALAADTLGAGQAMLYQAVAYAKQREQFGRTIATFQAVKHLCAEMAAELEPCRALVWYAAHAFAEVPADAALTAAHAKAHLAEVGRFVARTATEVHGGMGFTDLLGLHFWFKRIGFDRQALGSPELLREHVAHLEGWTAAA